LFDANNFIVPFHRMGNKTMLVSQELHRMVQQSSFLMVSMKCGVRFGSFTVTDCSEVFFLGNEPCQYVSLWFGSSLQNTGNGFCTDMADCFEL